MSSRLRPSLVRITSLQTLIASDHVRSYGTNFFLVLYPPLVCSSLLPFIRVATLPSPPPPPPPYSGTPSSELAVKLMLSNPHLRRLDLNGFAALCDKHLKIFATRLLELEEIDVSACAECEGVRAGRIPSPHLFPCCPIFFIIPRCRSVIRQCRRLRCRSFLRRCLICAW